MKSKRRSTITFILVMVVLGFLTVSGLKAQSSHNLPASNYTASIGSVNHLKNLSSVSNKLRNRVIIKKGTYQLGELINLIASQIGLKPSYSKEFVPVNKKVQLPALKTSAKEVLAKILKETSLNFKVLGGQLVFVERNQVIQETVTGTVTNAKTGATLPGVNILIKGTTTGTTTNLKGKYELSVSSLQDTMVVTYVGFEKKAIPINGRTEIDIAMQPKTVIGEELVVVGYGTQEKESVVSAISRVEGEVFRNSTAGRNLTSNLAGRVAGLIAVQRSTEPGYDNAEFWIRGISTFAGGTQPLVLVDGVPREISDVTPQNIASFTVLKDAAATAVYGAEGANGVIIIKTRRGRKQSPQFSFRVEQNISQPTRLPEFVGSAKYLTLYNEALQNDGMSPKFSSELIAKYRRGEDRALYPNTDWVDALLRDYTTSSRYTLNVLGGTDRVKYFVSGGYFSESGIFKGDPTGQYQSNIGIDRFKLRSNIDLNLTSSTTVQINLSGKYMLGYYPGSGTHAIFRQTLITPPHAFPAVYPDGTLATFSEEGDSNMRNPYNMLMKKGYSKEWRTNIQSTVRLKQDLDFLVDGLLFSGQVSFDYESNYYSTRSKDPSRYHAVGRDENGELIFKKVFSGSDVLSSPKERSYSDKLIFLQAKLNYSRSFGEHDIGAMAVYNQRSRQYYNNALPFRSQGMVGRITYSYDSRYSIEANFGYTGSATFAEGYRFGFFPAVGVAYNISNEPFFPSSLKGTVSKLKLRASIGRTGNDDTGGARFLYRPSFINVAGFNKGVINGRGINGLGGLTVGRFEAPYLGWETEIQKNFGIDLGLFHGKIQLSANYFTSKRKGILMQRRTVPPALGFRQRPWDNFGVVKNWGFDGNIETHHTIGEINFNLRGTFTFARNKILEYDELPKRHPWMEVTGTRVNENTVFIADRLYTRDDFIITENPNGTESYKLKDGIPKPTMGGLIAPGDIKYVDLNEDGVINSFDKKRGVGHPYTPEIVYGFGININYKGISVSAFFQGVANTTVRLGGDEPQGWMPFSWGVQQSNYRKFALNRWTPENPSQDVLMPRLHHNSTAGRNNYKPSTWWLRDGSFLRFKNLKIGYQLPTEFLERFKVENMEVYIRGNNLMVWDNINYWDPETGNSNAGFSYPKLRTITFGVDLKF